MAKPNRARIDEVRRAARPQAVPEAAETVRADDRPAAIVPDVRLVEFRDLADESVITGSTVRWTSHGERVAAVIPASGRVSIPNDVAPEDVSIDAPFLVAGSTIATRDLAPRRYHSPPPVREFPIVWVYREIDVRGSINGDTGASRFELSWAVLVGGPGNLPGWSHAPYSVDWLTKNRLAGRHTVQSLRSGEEVRFKAPRVRGLALVCRDSDRLYVPDIRRQIVSASTERIQTDFDPLRCPSVSGTITNARKSLENLVVAVYVRRETVFAEFDQDYLSLRGNTITGGGSTVPGAPWEVTCITSVTPGPGGVFSVPVPEAGEAMIEMRLGERSVSQTSLGKLERGVSGLVLELPPELVPRHLLLLVDGKPLAGGTVYFADGGAAVGTPAHGPFRSDESGAIDASSLVTERPYYVLADCDAARRCSGWFTWSGQASIDLARDLRREK